MNVSFVNKYTVTREGYVKYHHLKPGSMQQAAARQGQPDRSGVRAERAGSLARILGLCLALVIVLIAVMGRMLPFIIVGIILAGIYGLRIMQKRDAKKAEAARLRPQRKMPQTASDNAGDDGGKWTRYVRFGDKIEVEDPGITKEYQYDDIMRISDDAAYLTLWTKDGSQVRVSKTGFTLGTLQGFESFIMGQTNRMIGPGKSDAPADADAKGGTV